MSRQRFALVLNVLVWFLVSARGQYPDICASTPENECLLNDQCAWVKSATCICVDDDSADFDIYFVMDASQITETIWNNFMMQLISDSIDYIVTNNTNVYVLRFGDSTTEFRQNPTVEEIDAWSYTAQTEASVCQALEETENYLNTISHNRGSMVVTIFGNTIDDGPCTTTSLSASVLYGVLDDNVAASNEYEFLGYDGQCWFDFGLSFTKGIVAMEEYALSAVSDLGCALVSSADTTPSPTTSTPHSATTEPPTGDMTPTKFPTTAEYVPYVQWVYRRYKPERIHLSHKRN